MKTNKTFEQLSAEVARNTEFRAGERLQSEQLGSLLAAVSGLKRSPKRRILPMVAAFSVAALVLLILSAIFVFRTQNEDAIAFWVGRLPVEGEPNLDVMSTADETVPIQFSGGSKIELRENTLARVLRSREDRVVVDLRRGLLSANIRKRGKTEWIVRSGRYRVKVLGTSFEVNWQPESKQIEVTVRRGIVEVYGPGIASEGKRLTVGQTFSNTGHGSINVKSVLPKEQAPITSDDTEAGLVAQTENRTDSEAPSALEPSQEGHPFKNLPSDTHRTSRKDTTATSSDISDWRVFLEQGNHAKAIDTAETYGIRHLCTTLPIDELWRLAEAARYAHRDDISKMMLKTVRRKSPHSHLSSTASFILGKLALDMSDLDDAAEWFSMYLKENPNGPMAEEALGRLIWIHQRLGRLDAAKQTAEKYRILHPDGPFKHVAEAVLNVNGNE